HALKSLATFGVQPVVIGAGRYQNAFCPEHSAATFHLKTSAIFLASIIIKGERLRRCRELRTEPICLKLRQPGEIAADYPGRETKKVFDQRRGAGLAAWRVTFQNDRVQSFGTGVNRSGQSGRTCTDDRQVGFNFVFFLESERTQQTGDLCDFAQGRPTQWRTGRRDQRRQVSTRQMQTLAERLSRFAFKFDEAMRNVIFVEEVIE